MPQPTTSPLLGILRERTRPLHDQLDSAPLSRRLFEPGLTRPEYQRLVSGQAVAHAATEVGLAAFAWPGPYRYHSRAEVLAEVVGPSSSSGHGVAPLSPPEDLAAAVGRAYVLEGASLGGARILKRLRATPALSGESFPFYTHQRDYGLRQWRSFVAFVGERDWDEAGEEQAVAAARRVFTIFGAALA